MFRRTIASSLPSLVALASVALLAAGCGSGGGSAGDEDRFAGAPKVTEVLPHVAVSSGYIYVEGQNLASTKGKFESVSVRIDGNNDFATASKEFVDAEVFDVPSVSKVYIEPLLIQQARRFDCKKPAPNVCAPTI